MSNSNNEQHFYMTLNVKFVKKGQQHTLDLSWHKVLTCFEGRLPSSSENKLQLKFNETILA